MEFSRPILIVGAGSTLGLAAARRLVGRGHRVIATLRRRGGAEETALKALGCELETLDLADAARVKPLLERSGAAIFTPILSLSQVAAPFLKPDQPCVFFSSYNVCVDPDAPVYAALLEAEGSVQSCAPHATVLRPTMIYGHRHDGNLSRLMRTIERWPAVPIMGAGAVQQPVFFEDVAEAAVDALLGSQAKGRVFAVAGPDKLAMLSLFRAVAKARGRSPMLAPAPARLIARAVSALEAVGAPAPLSSAQLRRVCVDKAVADGEPAIIGPTNLETGLARLAASLDATEVDA